MQRSLVVSLIILISIGLSIYLFNTKYNEPLQVKVKDISMEPEKYNGKTVIISGVITRISNGNTIYTLWDDNKMVTLNIPDEFKKDLKINENIEVEGVVRIENNKVSIDVKRYEYR